MLDDYLDDYFTTVFLSLLVIFIWHVHSCSPYPFALHWHGLDMLNEQYMDGVAAITQCKAAPHQTQVYEFKVTNKGTHYWHGRKCKDCCHVE